MKGMCRYVKGNVEIRDECQGGYGGNRDSKGKEVWKECLGKFNRSSEYRMSYRQPLLMCFVPPHGSIFHV